ncbi:MAG: hypothetical protein AAFN79_12470 [Pseudomonadota bacterium]
MSKRFIINAATTFKDRDGNDRTKYRDCGTAFVNRTRDGAEVINLKFDFIPTPAPGQHLEIVCFEPKAKDDQDPVTE